MFGLGAFVSVVYVVVIGWQKFPALLNIGLLPLNELGDFLAGVFGPLAFFWLILGYAQQQKELKQNTSALELQARELKNSVDQYKEIVKTAREQLESDKAAFERAVKDRFEEIKPRFIFTKSSYHSRNGKSFGYSFILKNIGMRALDVKVESEPKLFELRHYQTASMDKDEELKLTWKSDQNNKAPDEIFMHVTAKNAVGEMVQQNFQFISTRVGTYSVM